MWIIQVYKKEVSLLYLKNMGNKVLGKRAKSFYRGFSVRQVEYLKEKF